MQASAPDADTELVYALRLALKIHTLTADLATLRTWAAHDKTSAERVADVCLAVTTPAAAEFLLGHLETTKFTGVRAGDFARHAVQQLPPDQFEKVLPLMRSLSRAPLGQRIAFAEGLAKIAAKKESAPKTTTSVAASSDNSDPKRDEADSASMTVAPLPSEAETWMRDELVAAVDDTDAALALRAINALKPLPFPEKAAPLRAVALNPKLRESNRSAALRALAPEHPETDDVLITVLAGTGPLALRKTAAELLGSAKAAPAARSALVAAYAGAPAEFALTLTTALAKSDAGTAELLDLAASGRVRPTLLRHRYVAVALEKRPSATRERVAKLTAGLPAEDARLDALIAQRVSAASTFKADASRGAPVFATHCASCHKFRDQGGTLGPSLDGLESRAVARIIEDILDPSRNIDPAFQLTTVTLKSGETKSGLNPREQGDRLLLTEPGSGQEIVIAKSDIAETSASSVSAMPPAFETALSEQEFFDLLEFLRRPAK